MAGHSKWANIKHRKNKADAKKGKVFSRLAKEIISAVKLGGPDPKNNPRLRLAMVKAKEANLPNEIIDRNIKKASSEDQADFSEITYELYGHGGVGMIIDIMTDNKNRASSDMRIATNKRGGTIATPGSVAFNFDRKGVIQVRIKKAEVSAIPAKKIQEPQKEVKEDLAGIAEAEEEKLFSIALEAGADDFEVTEDSYMITSDPTLLFAIKDAITQNGFKCDEATLEMIPKSYIECDSENIKANLALIEWLEQLDDVDVVYHNMKIPEEVY